MQLDTERLKHRLQDKVAAGDRRKAQIQEEMTRLEQEKAELLEAVRRVESVETLAERFGEVRGEEGKSASESGGGHHEEGAQEGEFVHAGSQPGYEHPGDQPNPPDSGGEFDRWG